MVRNKDAKASYIFDTYGKVLMIFVTIYSISVFGFGWQKPHHQSVEWSVGRSIVCLAGGQANERTGGHRRQTGPFIL